MNVYQYLKILPLILFVSACTIDVASDPSDPESTDNDVSGNAVGADDPGTDVSTTADASPTADAGTTAGEGTNDVSPDVSGDVGNGDVDNVDVGQPGVVPPNDGTPSVDTQLPVVDDVADAQPEPDMQPEPVDESNVSDAIVRIPFTDRPNAPLIDGATLDYIAGTELLDGEWRSAAQFNSDNEPLDINQYLFGEPGTNNDSANHHWAAKHDGEYLYILVVSDDAGEHYQDTNEARKPWKDDSIEIFIDGNHSRLTEYDGVDDFHMTINLFSSAGIVNHTYNGDPKIRQSDVSATLPSDLIFAAGPERGPLAVDVERGRKDIYEIRIKLSELNIEVGTRFGIEVQINDDDNGGDRDSKWAWIHPEGNSSDNDITWQNPSFMGTAILLR